MMFGSLFVLFRAVVTMSTVGYGDSVPETIRKQFNIFLQLSLRNSRIPENNLLLSKLTITAGKLIGSGAIVCGVMVLALPITIMVKNHFIILAKIIHHLSRFTKPHGESLKRC